MRPPTMDIYVVCEMNFHWRNPSRENDFKILKAFKSLSKAKKYKISFMKDEVINNINEYDADEL